MVQGTHIGGLSPLGPGFTERAGAVSAGRLHALITGRVQGVGFRHFVLREAQQLDLRGFVRNAGKQVEVVAEGEAETLERLLSSLRVGPSGARVDHVQHSCGQVVPLSRGFEIRATAQ